MAASRLDLAILREIVRIVQEKARVPEKVRILKRFYALTYLEDHRQRIEEALRRFDSDRVNMLFGQLASKVKYQMIRDTPRRPALAVAKSASKSRAVAAPKRAVAEAKRPPASERSRAPKRPSPAKRQASAKQPAKPALPKRAPRPQRSAKRVAQPKRAARKLKAKKRPRQR